MSWDPSVATTRCSSLETIHKTVWSPCSRFIAVSFGATSGTKIQILDAVTLKQLKIFTPLQYDIQLFAFSPESRSLTLVGGKSKPLVSWDLQTGVQVSEIPMEGSPTYSDYSSITHSECGTMFGVLFKDKKASSTIGTYDILSSTPMYCHSIKGLVADTIWTHGECLQFATFGPQSLTMWEVGFSSKHPPTELKSLPTPNHFNSPEKCIFLPTPTRLAFTFEETVFVWDAQQSKFLLSSAGIHWPRGMNFSSDGHFFTCATSDEFYLWRESPSNYILQQKLVQSAGIPYMPLLSPNGQSITMLAGPTVQLWRTTDSTISHSNTPTQVLNSIDNLILGFSPDGLLAVAARLRDNLATVINLKSNVIQLVIDTGIDVYGVGVTGSTVVIVGDKIIAWNIPAGDHVSNARANINDSVWTTMFSYSETLRLEEISSVSISSSCNQIAILGGLVGGGVGLVVCNASTGETIAGTNIKSGWPPLWLTPDGHEVWCGQFRGHGGWAIVKDSEANTSKLECLDRTRHPSGGFPWESSNGYQVTDDGWILSSSRKRLLWLPPHWRMGERDMVWYGQVLGLLYCELPEVVILKVLEE